MPSGSGAGHQTWLKGLADTAAQSLYKIGLDQISAPQSGYQTYPERATYLESQWREGLSGPRAPYYLLYANSGKASAKLDQSGNSSEVTSGRVPLYRSLEPAQGQDNRSILGNVDQELPGQRFRQIRTAIDPGRYSRGVSEIAQAEAPRPPLSAPEVAAGHSAREGLIGSEEDAVALAAKIKRILDDEARRYGINV
jgi:hypothetical protein